MNCVFFYFICHIGFVCSYQLHNEKMYQTIKKLKTKGILAMDESIPTIGKRFSQYNILNNKKNRNKYRNIVLLQTPDLNKYVSGCILCEETALQKSVIKNLHNNKILAGVKLDEGLIEFNKHEFLTMGLENVKKKCKKFADLGITFAKWRCVFHISKSQHLPSNDCIQINCNTLANFASICQKENIVPIIEPEIVMEGNHTIYDTAKVQEIILKNLFFTLSKNDILLETIILKTNMVLPGKEASHVSYPTQIANLTIQTFERSVPSAVPIIALLSGGIEENMASLYLKHIRRKIKKAKWYITFSFGRALQHSCLKTWNNNKKNTYEAQKQLLAKLIQNTHY